jgi:cell division protein FtsB
MAIGHILRRRARFVLVPVLGALLVAYFGYHAIEGDRGLLAYLKLTQELKKAEISQDLIAADRQIIERRVALLRPNGVDPDMLDERARLMLDLGRRDELTIMLQRSDGSMPVITQP